MGLISRYLFKQVFGRAAAEDEETISKSTEDMMGPNFKKLKDFTQKNTAILLKHASTRLSIITADGLRLYGDLYTNPTQTDKTIICVHGYHSEGMKDYASVGLEYLKRGFNVLIVNNRACGPSEGEVTTFGVLESADTILWARRITELYPYGDILVQGCSMGAASVCMMSDKELSKNVKLIISDCAYASIREQFIFTLHRFMHIPTWPALQMLESEFKSHVGCDFETYSPLKSVAKSSVPIFFVHGREDRYVPPVNAQKLFDACASEKKLLFIQGAGHAAAHLYGGEAYYNSILSFASAYMTLPSSCADDPV